MLKYIHVLPNDSNKYVGVSNKIEGQINAFRNNGIVAKAFGYKKLSKIKRAIPFSSSSINWKEVDVTDSDILYIRYPMSDLRFILFLRKIKRKMGIPIFIEIATYPYEKELSRYSIITIRDKLYRRFLMNYVDFIFYIGGDGAYPQDIYGVKCARISNGIDFQKYRIVRRKPSNTIRMIAVAEFQKIHGYERIIRGIADYYRKGGGRSISFTLVGEGGELSYYKELTSKLELNNYIHFKGKMVGEELNAEFDNSDIGVESFGFYKIDISTSSSLKSREYLARGLPYISGVHNDIIDDVFPFCLFFYK